MPGMEKEGRTEDEIIRVQAGEVMFVDKDKRKERKKETKAERERETERQRERQRDRDRGKGENAVGVRADRQESTVCNTRAFK